MRRPAKDPLKLSTSRLRWLGRQVAQGKFNDLNEALGFCVDEAARLDSVRSEFDRQIAEGDAGPFDRVDADWWSRLKADSAAARKGATRRKTA